MVTRDVVLVAAVVSKAGKKRRSALVVCVVEVDVVQAAAVDSRTRLAEDASVLALAAN